MNLEALVFPAPGEVAIRQFQLGVEDRQKTVAAIHRGEIASADFIEQIVPFRQAPQAYPALR